MHGRWEPASLAIQAKTTPSQTTLRRSRERALMTINAFRIIAIVSLLTRGLARHNPQTLQFGGRECVVMVVGTLVGLAGIVVAAADANVVLIASLQLLKALDFVSVVLHGCVEAVALLVTLNRSSRHARRRDEPVLNWTVSRGDFRPCSAILGVIHRRLGTMVGTTSHRIVIEACDTAERAGKRRRLGSWSEYAAGGVE